MQTPDNQEPKSRREQTLSRLRERHPERNLEDEEELFGAINDEYDEYDKDLQGYRDREDRLTGLFSENPQSARFLTNWVKGEDPIIGLVKAYGVEIRDILDDPERQAEIAEANKEYVERVAKEKDLEETYQQNIATSLTTLEQLQKERGLSDEEVDGAMGWLLKVIEDGIIGKFAPETIEMALKAANYDTDVAGARAEGEVKGRNTKIEEKLRKPKGGDGLPTVGGATNTPGQRRQPSIFDLASMA